jgi:CheY-like chemotaxis protein
MAQHRIIIVEDQREVSRLLRSTIETLEVELEVMEIPSGEEAILYSSSNQVDLLVSDYRLPGMSGVELMHKVQKNQPRTRVILVTGQTDPRIRTEVAEAGANAFFIKPVPMADFLETVEHLLGLVEQKPIPGPTPVEGTEIQQSLVSLLDGFRQELAASAVFLLTGAGRIMEQAGDLPDSDNKIALISSLLSIQSAGKKVARLIGQTKASTIYSFCGVKYDLVFFPVGTTHSLMVIGKGIASDDQVLKKVEVFSLARKNIEAMLNTTARSESAIQEPLPIPEVSVGQGNKEMTPILNDSRKKLKTAEVNEFWNKAADNHKATHKPDMLSYEQAKQLGLAPEDES